MATDVKPGHGVKPVQATAAPADAGKDDRQVVDKEMRQLYQEIARLSATLGLARKACYESKPGKAREALELLDMQLPVVKKLVSILAPSDV